AYEEPESDRVISGGGPRFPQRCLRGQQRGHLLPVVEIFHCCYRLLPAGKPEAWLIRWLTLIRAFPFAANSGQYLATGASKSNSPRSAISSAVSAVMVLVVE